MAVFYVDKDELWPYYRSTPADKASSYELRFHKPVELTDEEAQLVIEATEMFWRVQDLLEAKLGEES